MGSVTPTTPSTVQYVKKIDYALDDDGNRTSVTTTPWGLAPTVENYTSNALDLYTSVGGVGRTYDANANVTNTGTYTFKYNYLGLVCEARTAGTNTLVATYQFDVLGRRIRKAVAGGATDRFVYWDRDIIEKLKPNNVCDQQVVPGRWTPAKYCRTMPELYRPEERRHAAAPVMIQSADFADFDDDSDLTELTRSFCHGNWCGSVMEITDMNQNEVESFGYSPTGQISISRGGVAQGADVIGQSFGWCGGFHDAEIGAVFCGSGWYDPATARVVSGSCAGELPGCLVDGYGWCGVAWEFGDWWDPRTWAWELTTKALEHAPAAIKAYKTVEQKIEDLLEAWADGDTVAVAGNALSLIAMGFRASDEILGWLAMGGLEVALPGMGDYLGHLIKLLPLEHLELILDYLSMLQHRFQSVSDAVANAYRSIDKRLCGTGLSADDIEVLCGGVIVRRYGHTFNLKRATDQVHHWYVQCMVDYWRRHGVNMNNKAWLEVMSRAKHYRIHHQTLGGLVKWWRAWEVQHPSPTPSQLTRAVLSAMRLFGSSKKR